MANLARITFGAATNYADVTAPTLVSAEVQLNGTDFEIVFSEIVTIGAGGNGGFTVTASGGAATLTYASGSGSDTLVYTLSRTVNSGETFSAFAYTQPGNGVEDLAGNDLATFTGQHGSITNSSGESGFTYLLEEDFEGSEVDSQGEVGYDNTGWTSSSTSNTPRYATSPAPLEGSYSFYPGTSSRSITKTISGNPRSFYLMARVVATTANLNFLLKNGATTLAKLEITSGVKLRPVHGTVTGTSSVDGFATGTTWHLWIDYVPSTGSNGVLTLAFSADTTKPTSGNKFTSLTTGDAALEIDTLVVAGLGSQVIFDKIRAAATEIGSDPA